MEMAQGGAARSIPGISGTSPFVTVGGANANFPVEQYGNDAGLAVNAAGSLLKAAHGGTVYIVGGIGTVFAVSTQLIFYNSVNYIGDGVTLKAAPNLVNPFTTDPLNAYYSGYIASLTLDGSDVPGTTILTCISIQYCTFADVIVQNANAPVIPVPIGRSPTAWQNPSSTVPAFVQVFGGKVTGISINGAATGMDAGLVYVPPSGTLSVVWAEAPTINVSNGTAVLLTANQTIGAPPQSNKRFCATNCFESIHIRGCSIGWILSGALEAAQVTNNIWTESSTMFCTVCAIAYVNNCDSNSWLETQLKISGNGAVAIAFNLLTPTADAQVYFNRHLFCSVDTSNFEGQIGVQLNANQSRPNFILLYQPNPQVPVPVANYNRSRAFIHDVVNKSKYVLHGNRTGSGWRPEEYPGSNAPFTNSTPFSMLLLVQGGGISAIRLNGQLLGMTGGLFPLKPGDSLVCTSSSVPTTFTSMLSDF
jgi:hypothetical protein